MPVALRWPVDWALLSELRCHLLDRRLHWLHR
jgi:hypothetical protein